MRSGSVPLQGQHQEGAEAQRFRRLGRLTSPAEINRVLTAEMDKVQKSITVMYRRTGYELALVGISETGGPDMILKLATPGLSPLITDQWLDPEKTLPAVQRQTQLNTIMRQNREMAEKGDHLTFTDLPQGAQIHLLKGLLHTALPGTRKAPYNRTTTTALLAMSIHPYGTCSWFPANVEYRDVERMDAEDRLQVFRALARHSEQNAALRLALENSIYSNISWDNSMAASFFIVFNREMRAACITAMPCGLGVPPSSDALVGRIPSIPIRNLEIGVPARESALPRRSAALDTEQDNIKGDSSI